MYEVFFLQVLHGRGDLRGHVQQHHSVDLLAVALPQVVQQVAVGHELSDDVEGRLPRAHACAHTRTRVDGGTRSGVSDNLRLLMHEFVFVLCKSKQDTCTKTCMWQKDKNDNQNKE